MTPATHPLLYGRIRSTYNRADVAQSPFLKACILISSTSKVRMQARCWSASGPRLPKNEGLYWHLKKAALQISLGPSSALQHLSHLRIAKLRLKVWLRGNKVAPFHCPHHLRNACTCDP